MPLKPGQRVVCIDDSNQETVPGNRVTAWMEYTIRESYSAIINGKQYTTILLVGINSGAVTKKGHEKGFNADRFIRSIEGVGCEEAYSSMI